jgi:hypothetical protein
MSLLTPLLLPSLLSPSPPPLFSSFHLRVASIPYYASDGKWLSALEEEILKLRATLLADLREHRYPPSLCAVLVLLCSLFCYHSGLLLFCIAVIHACFCLHEMIECCSDTDAFIIEPFLLKEYEITDSDTGSGSCSLTVNEGGSDREVYEEMKRLYRILGATVIQVTTGYTESRAKVHPTLSPVFLDIVCLVDSTK